MNKNILKLLAVLMLCFALVSVLVACGEGKEGPAGKDGVDGKSPYMENGKLYVWDDAKNDFVGYDINGEDGEDLTCGGNVHEWDMEAAQVYTTHTKEHEGILLVPCKNCDILSAKIDKHVEGEVVVENDVKPTCTTDGSYDNVVYCTICEGELSRKTETVKKLGHNVVEFDPAEPTANGWTRSEENDPEFKYPCEKQDAYSIECDRCHETFFGLTEPANHNIPAFDVTNPTANGWELADDESGLCSCERQPSYGHLCHNEGCNYKEVALGTATNHNYGEWTVVTPATLVSEGSAKRVCANKCTLHGETGCTDTVVLPALDETHYTLVKELEPTCTTDGKYVYTYKGDANGKGAGIAVEYIPSKTGHSYVNATTNLVTAPTAEVEGKLSVTCVNGCGHNEEVTLPVLNDTNYNFTQGDCEKKDSYTKDLTVGDAIVEFKYEVPGQYRHQDMAAEDTYKEVDGDYYRYYLYQCPNCGKWVVDKAVRLEDLENEYT